ncbi:disintegrin and metalloproteinase domain-containing protein 2 isoform X2 [Dasypus novemcinctus]|uniref:disintegrin and metalloproteinase domain-containing protein 2 isoform X2 n=1 Tax=Dasypus novemcinctus TaxID=9361 RepID=UPI00265FF990|nr:disintegrin and metalloproteinase domain-containing protein 2 isoform X2 [Dasypus novemcinctus]
MFGLLLLLTGLSRLGASQDSERLRVQITVPKKIQSIKSGEVESEVSYNILIDGKTHTVKLMQKTFLPTDFVVYAYNGTESMKPLEQQLQNFCFYQGYIEGFPNSVALISTCAGLRGLLQFENVTYGIEPLESSVGFEHVIYQVRHKNASVSLYTEKDTGSKDQPYKIQSVKPLPDFSQYIEMHVVIEKNLYNYMGSDTTVVTQKIFQLFGLTNAIFASVNITVILSSLELWIDENKILTTGDANELLHRFLEWKRSYLVLRPHDVAFLLVYREHADYIGATFQGKMCDRKYGGGVLLHPKIISMESFAVILVQLVSLNMGIAYDDINKCHCSGTICIMNPEAIHSSGVKMFSNCSMEEFAHFITKSKSRCLQNQPRLDPSYKQAVCGDGRVEGQEQCDCGTERDCETSPLGNCCNHDTCTLKSTSVCGAGECCEECQILAKGTPCRDPVDECDLTEYCNGSSAVCPENVFVQNGHPCGLNQWFCVDGVCNSGGKQCADMFGEGASFGTQACFTRLNSMTDLTGNCGSGPSGYVPCATEDLQCGKLICTYERNTVIRFDNGTTIYANIEGTICVAVEYGYDNINSRRMWVKDGTACGQNKACKNMHCVDSSFFGYDCTSDKCNNQGVCNNLKHCHCNPSYLPPDCSTEDSNWGGGSVDSGNFPPAQTSSLTYRKYIENIYSSKPSRWQFYLLIPFFIIFCALIAILVKLNFQRKKWSQEEYTSDEVTIFDGRK